MAANDRLTLKEAAELLGMNYGVAKTKRWRGTFPTEDGYLGDNPWWYRSKLLAWKRDRTEQTA